MAIIIGSLALAIITTAAALVYTIDSNTAHVQWQLGCSSNGPVCVFFSNAGGNSSLVNYNIRILSIQDVTNQYINTTIYNVPPHIVFSLNGTSGTQWLNGPYAFTHNVAYNFDFRVAFNGTVGSYDFAVNVLQAK